MTKNCIWWKKGFLNDVFICGYISPGIFYDKLDAYIHNHKGYQKLLIKEYLFRDTPRDRIEEAIDWNISVLALHDELTV